MTKKCLIAGVGNTLRSDDGIGIKVLTYLKKNLPSKNFDFLEFANKSIDIINYITKYSGTFIIDTVQLNMPPGSVKSFGLEDININPSINKTSSHDISLKDLLNLLNTLDIKNKVYIIGMQPKNLSYGEKLSEEVYGSFPVILSEIKKLYKLVTTS